MENSRLFLIHATQTVAKISALLNYISMAVLFLIGAIVFSDIVLRLTVEVSVLGTYEITEMGMIVVIFGALAHTQVFKGHLFRLQN